MNCWKCGIQDPTAWAWREVCVGRSDTMGTIGPSSGQMYRSKHYQRVALCGACCTDYDQYKHKEKNTNAIVALVFFLVLFGGGYWLLFHRI